MPKGNGKQKERTRSISLDIDVSEIAQKLADRGELSSTISELLRQAYGFGDKIEEKKQELTALLDEKDRIREKERQLIDEIDTLESETLEKRATILPQLTERLKILEERRIRVQREANTHVDRHIIAQKHRVLDNIDRLISECKLEMEAFQ